MLMVAEDGLLFTIVRPLFSKKGELRNPIIVVFPLLPTFHPNFSRFSNKQLVVKPKRSSSPVTKRKPRNIAIKYRLILNSNAQNVASDRQCLQLVFYRPSISRIYRDSNKLNLSRTILHTLPYV